VKQNYVTMTKLKMAMDFDYLNEVTSTKLNKANDKNVNHVQLWSQNFVHLCLNCRYEAF